jgi:uncharacterized short protein YbdD (DUF466 family)
MRLTDWLRRAAVAIRTVIGVPDYDRYADHQRRCHADVAPMSREDFMRAALAQRYERPGSRCC